MKRIAVPLLLAPVLLALGIASPAAADVLVLLNGKKLVGGIQHDGPDGVKWNPYFSRDPGMVFDVRSFPRSRVKKAILVERPFSEFLRRRMGLAPGDVEGHLALAEWCRERKLKEEADLALLDVLRRDPAEERALKAYGKSRFRKLARGNPDFDPEVRKAVDAYLAIRDPGERGKAFARLRRGHSFSLPREYLDRILRSRDQPRGLVKDRPLTLGSTESPGVYTIFVPKEYDPRRAWPLVLGLHGGGPGGKDRDAVVGSGPSAMNFYIRQAAARGYLVVCPTARAAPWAATPNRAFLRSVLREVELLYHVDLNRVYLTGHSMGGFGTWYYGPLWAETWAAVSPMAGGGSGIHRLIDTNTPVFIFHGADDPVVGPGSDRAAARALAGTGHDFIYTELAGVGHGFPASIQKALFDFFDLRRLAPVRGRRAGPPSAKVRSSFLAKVTREEKRFLGDPLEYGGAEGTGKSEWKRLLKDLKLGGGNAEAAATRLGELKDPHSVKPVGDLLRNPKVPDDVKLHAARALGAIGSPEGYAGLAAGLRSENPEVFTASARAMAAIRAPKSGEALARSLDHVMKVIDGKRIGGNRILFTDWERWLGALAAAVRGIADRKPPGGWEAVERTAVKKVLEADWDVIHSRRVRQDPKAALRKLREAVEAARSAYG